MATSTISDDELRNQLEQLGVKVGPITDSTRPLLLRKLKRLQKEGAGKAKEVKKDTRRKSPPSSVKKRQSPSRRLLGFSSDEEEDKPSYRPRRRVATGRGVRIKEEDDNPMDDVDASKDDDVERSQDRSKDQGNSTHSYSDVPNTRDEFSDSDAYTGPFQRGSYRFRSFRRKKDSPESSKINRQSKETIHTSDEQADTADEIPVIDTTDGVYNPNLKRTSFSSLFNAVAFVIVLICVVLLVAYYQNVFPVGKYGITSPDSVILPFCKAGYKNENCLDRNAVRDRYVHYLIDVLSTQAGQFDCGSESVTSRNISKEELKKTLDDMISNDYPSWNDTRRRDIMKEVIEFLTKQKPEESGIRCYDKHNKHANINDSAVYWYESDRPYKSLVCRIQESFSKVLTGILVVVCVFIVLFGVYFGVRNHWHKEEEDARKMYKLVENIIDILRKHHDECKTDKDLPPYLPIPHVRDMLIKPAERKTMSNVWNRAVRFLSANESRIRVESQRIAGEDFEVWRWIHIMSPKHNSHKVSLQDTKKPKCWQGQAFVNFQWAVNPPVISPTPCLKIRNMFDPDVELDDRWQVIIQDAILEKCFDAGTNVVHIAVDMSSCEGCVYVKCDSNDSAGVAFKSLHGCWFDGRLVAVKYLTLRRYHQRFPKALTATGSLKPSGTSPSSLVTLDPEEDMEVNDSETEV